MRFSSTMRVASFLVGACGLASRLILSMMAPIFLWHLRAVVALHLAKFAFLFRENRVTYKSVSPVRQPFQTFTALALHKHSSARIHSSTRIYTRGVWLTWFLSYFFWWGMDYQVAGAEKGLEPSLSHLSVSLSEGRSLPCTRLLPKPVPGSHRTLHIA